MAAATAVFWDAPTETRYLAYGTAVQVLALAMLAAMALFAYEVAKRRVPVSPWGAALLLSGLAACVAGFLAVTLAVGLGHPAWDQEASLHLGSLSGGAAGTALRGLAVAGSFPFALAALFGLFAWAAARGRWTEAYFALGSGAGLAGLVIVAKILLPRAALTPQPFFTGATAYPNDTAALVPMALALGLFLHVRLRGTRIRPAHWLGAALLGSLLVLAPVAARQAWASDALAGLLLAGAWFLFSIVVLLLVEEGLGFGRDAPPGAAASERSLLLRALDRADRGAQRVFARPAPWLWGIIAAGVALRVASYWWMPLGVDAYVYAVMGNQMLHTGSFWMPWGDVHTYLTAPVASHHYPPLYPIYLAGFYQVLGFSRATTHLAAIASSLAALVVVWACTRDLYGRTRALVATAALAVSPIFVQNTGQGYSENLVLLLFVATLWAILRSLERPWFILPAGILAGLGYLTKSSMGYFFIIAGLGGLAWRLYWKGLRVLRDPAYLAAILAFGSLVAGWAARNYLRFGSWETSQHISAAYRNALAHPLQWGFLVLVTFVFYATIGYLLYLSLLPWIPRLARMPKLESEHDSGLWLALGLPLLLTAFIDAALWLTEREFFVNNVRYIGFVAVPAVWLMLRHLDPTSRSVRLAAVATFLLLLAGAAFFAKPTESSIEAIADDLGPRLRPGDTVGFVDTNVHGVYRFFFQLTQDATREVPVTIACAADPLCPAGTPRPGTLNTTWVVMVGDGGSLLPPGYVPVSDSPAQFDPRFPNYMSLWHRG
ncbi:MAG TPA: glycosyltransferase family 39 protein [Candidatus Thermoplasmatota archaeon]|nr:glycosyltransferase family 39 protein [Candidatus Thermoplasmatota archaeon]